MRALLLTAVGLVLLSSCGEEKANVSTKLVSTSLAAAAGRALESSGCGTGYTHCITPTAVSGKAYYAGMIVGTTNGLSLGPLLGTVEDPSKAAAFSESELLAFNFGQQVALTGTPSLGGPIPYPADDQAYVRSFHVYLGYVDVTFTLTGAESGLGAQTHVVRQVLADISGTEMKKGDTLHRLSSETDFKWCVDGAGCAATTRPTTPIQDSDIANFTNTQEGNKTIPSFTVALASGHAQVQVKQSDLLDTAAPLTFTVDFDMAKGVKFTNNPSTWATQDDLAQAFRLPAEPGDSNAGFTATITVTKGTAR